DRCTLPCRAFAGGRRQAHENIAASDRAPRRWPQQSLACDAAAFRQSHGNQTPDQLRRKEVGGAIAAEHLLASHDVPIGATQVSLAQLNERSRDIFRQIVESYLATGEPVGSRNISRLITTPLSPASVRNVMSDLEQLGLIYAPHTSAGRLPTETGL